MNYYIALADLYRVHDMYFNNYEPGNKEWLQLKYFHTLHVVKAGEALLSKIKALSFLNEAQKQAFSTAFLMHDFGRAFEQREDGSFVPNYKHGAEGMHYIKTHCGITDVVVLASVMCHDQINEDLLDLSDSDLQKNAVFQCVSKEAQQSVMAVRRMYEGLSAEGKHLVKLACFAVKDADTYANLQDFRVTFKVTKEVQVCEITPAVLRHIMNKEYVDYRDVRTLPDRGLTYLAWINKFHFPETKQMVLDEKVPEQVRDHILGILRALNKFSEDELETVSEAFNQVALLMHDSAC